MVRDLLQVDSLCTKRTGNNLSLKVLRLGRTKNKKPRELNGALPPKGPQARVCPKTSRNPRNIWIDNTSNRENHVCRASRADSQNMNHSAKKVCLRRKTKVAQPTNKVRGTGSQGQARTQKSYQATSTQGATIDASQETITRGRRARDTEDVRITGRGACPNHHKSQARIARASGRRLNPKRSLESSLSSTESATVSSTSRTRSVMNHRTWLSACCHRGKIK